MVFWQSGTEALPRGCPGAPSCLTVVEPFPSASAACQRRSPFGRWPLRPFATFLELGNRRPWLVHFWRPHFGILNLYFAHLIFFSLFFFLFEGWRLDPLGSFWFSSDRLLIWLNGVGGGRFPPPKNSIWRPFGYFSLRALFPIFGPRFLFAIGRFCCAFFGLWFIGLDLFQVCLGPGSRRWRGGEREGISFLPSSPFPPSLNSCLKMIYIFLFG